MLHRLPRSQFGLSFLAALIWIALASGILLLLWAGRHTSKTYAGDMAAIRDLVSINDAEKYYFSEFGRYADTLPELAAATHQLSPDLARGTRHGYQFQMRRARRDGQAYEVSAVPQVFGRTGRRTFYTDQTLLIRHHWGPEPATPKSNVLR